MRREIVKTNGNRDAARLRDDEFASVQPILVKLMGHFEPERAERASELIRQGGRVRVFVERYEVDFVELARFISDHFNPRE